MMSLDTLELNLGKKLQGFTKYIGQLDFIGHIALESLWEFGGITVDIGQLDFIGYIELKSLQK